jgi:hypothetical protein
MTREYTSSYGQVVQPFADVKDTIISRGWMLIILLLCACVPMLTFIPLSLLSLFLVSKSFSVLSGAPSSSKAKNQNKTLNIPKEFYK